VQQTLGWIFTATDLPELHDEQREVAELRANRPDPGSMSNEEILAEVRSHLPTFRRLFASHLFTSLAATVPAGVIAQVCAELGDPGLAMRLLAGIGDVDSAAPSWAMWDLGRMAAESPELTAEFDTGVAGLLDRLRANGTGGDFLTAFDRFLYEFGSRGANEWEMRSPTW
jgi:rifampicin phosphotransferase